MLPVSLFDPILLHRARPCVTMNLSGHSGPLLQIFLCEFDPGAVGIATLADSRNALCQQVQCSVLHCKILLVS